ncbi:hypothetical protein ABZ354_12240 [Streptomyces sp. NPDC005925]|uniref:hypothetical protein n=1 Tax=Streptomyces sp. NPDC005925 TaxID=3157172 RepID=UPI0033E82B82
MISRLQLLGRHGEFDAEAEAPVLVGDEGDGDTEERISPASFTAASRSGRLVARVGIFSLFRRDR